MNAILVCVDYHDFLEVTLPYNRHHFDEVCVVTTPEDTRTHKIAREYNSQVYTTRAFYAPGYRFGKWLAMEEALDWFVRGEIPPSPASLAPLGSVAETSTPSSPLYCPPRPRYNGWLCVMDADILWPINATVDESALSVGTLYGPPRRMCRNVSSDASFFPDSSWEQYPYHRNTFRELASFSVVFHTADPNLTNPYPFLTDTPWFEADWIHCGGADSFFQKRWTASQKQRFSFDVLHLGEEHANWCGRATPYLDGSSPPDGEAKRKLLTKLLKLRRSDGFRYEKV